jgi:lipopolysaccharide export system permease protein
VSKNLYILKFFFKYFLVILGGLSLFFVAIDYMQVSKELPNSTNLQILYFYYKTLYASSILFPISIVFGAVLTFSKLVKDNSIIAFYSIGYSEKDLLTPIFVASIFLTGVFVSLHTTSFAYSKNIANEILNRGNPISENSKNLFFKYDLEENGKIKSYYIFFSKLYPLQNLAEGVRLFSLQNGKLAEVVRARYAFYENSHWVIYSARFLKSRDEISLNKKALEIEDRDKFFVLDGFKPEILDRIYESEIEFNLFDLIEAVKLMISQGFNIDKLKVALYNIVIYPLFAPLLIVVIFKFLPISSRFSNVNIFIFFSVVGSLLLWGTLFALVKLSFTGSFLPEFAIILPVLILSILAFYFTDS